MQVIAGTVDRDRDTLESTKFKLAGESDQKCLLDILGDHRNVKKREKKIKGEDVEDPKRLQEYRKLMKQ